MKVVKQKPSKSEVSVEDAAKVLQEAHDKKKQMCADEVNNVLEKHGFKLNLVYQYDLIPK